jgi:hypothetical protein
VTAFLDWLGSVAPHPVRRALHARLHGWDHRYLNGFRREATEDGYCLRPFDEHEVIFVHIPKAAGTSVCRSLFGCLAGGHTTIAQYQVVFAPSEFRRYFKFAFVRDPWDRLHSAYHFLRQGGLGGADRRFADEQLRFGSFDEFVRRWVNERNVERYVHFMPQHRFLCLPGRRAPAVDFIGRFENLAEDYEVVRRRIPGAKPLVHENRTGRGDPRAEYTDESRAIVARVYRRDIELLGY